MIHDPAKVKLGKRAPKLLRRLPPLSKFTAALPPAPPAYMNSDNIKFPCGMMANDRLGDCTCAAIGHAIQIWTGWQGKEVTLSDDRIVKLYSDACGYNPVDPSTDQGGVETDVLNYWLKNPIDAHALDAFASIKPANRDMIRTAIWLFGGAYIGLALPETAQDQDVWDVVPNTHHFWQTRTGPSPEPGSWGGHAVFVVDYQSDTLGAKGGLTCITWGGLKKMTWAFWDAYCDEAYALLSRDNFNTDGVNEEKFPFDEIKADMAYL